MLRRLELLSHFERARHKLGQSHKRSILPLPIFATSIPRISQQAKRLNAKTHDFLRISACRQRRQQNLNSFSAKTLPSARPSLLLPCIKTSEQLTIGIERTSQERQFIAGVAEMFSSVLSKVAARFVRDQRGATMLEYGLLVGLVAIAAIIAVTAMGGALSNMFTDASNAL
jgi:pilus assembly protein Flp/PilA